MTSEIVLLRVPGPGDAPSMSRYAAELYSAIRAVPGMTRPVVPEEPGPPRRLSRLVSSPLSRRLDNAWWRYVSYPRRLHHRAAALWHVLDHSDAHLVRAIDADRTVVTCHDLIPLLAAAGAIPIQVPAHVVRTFRWRVGHLARARIVIAISEATKSALERYTSVAPDRIVVIPHGVSSSFRVDPAGGAARRASINAPSSRKIVLQVATRGRYKNTPALLHAFAALRARGHDALLVRIGVPFYPDEAGLARDLALTGWIEHLGRIPDDRTLAEWYNAADVLLFPSLWEGLGLPPLEAMACGTPVVASNIPAIAEVVADAGALVPADDPAAIANAAERVLTDAAHAAAMRRKGLDRAAHFTWARVAAATLDVYERVFQYNRD